MEQFTNEEYANQAAEATRLGKVLYVINGSLVIDEPGKYILIRGKYVPNPKFDKNLVNSNRKMLYELNKSIKCEKLKNGIIVNYDTDILLFKTDEESISNINITLIRFNQNLIKNIEWKFSDYKNPDNKIYKKLTKKQFINIFNFYGELCDNLFEKERLIKQQISNLTEDDLKDNCLVKKQIYEIENCYKTLTNQLTLD